MKRDVDGITETLDAKFIEKYGDVFNTCCESMDMALKIVRSEGYEDRSTWKSDAKNDHVTVHYKDIDGIRFFAARTRVPVPPAVGHSINWEQISEMSEWNSNVKFSKVVEQIHENMDLTHYASNDLLVVKSREFVCGRMRRVVDGSYILSARSCLVETIPETNKAVRAFLALGFGRYREDPTSPEHAIYDYVVSMELRGMMFQSMVNQIMGKLVLSDVENNRKNAEAYNAKKSGSK